jgi:hypothetical protein
LKVWGKEAMTLKVRADEGKLHEGVPYHVYVGVENKSDVPLYNVNLTIEENPHVSFIFQLEQQFSELVGELKPGETFFVKRPYILIPDAESVSVSTVPTVSSVSPASGTVSGGTNITITGTGFVSGATVEVGQGIDQSSELASASPAGTSGIGSARRTASISAVGGNSWRSRSGSGRVRYSETWIGVLTSRSMYLRLRADIPMSGKVIAGHGRAGR